MSRETLEPISLSWNTDVSSVRHNSPVSTLAAENSQLPDQEVQGVPGWIPERWRFGLASWGISILVHVVLLVVLSCVVFEQPRQLVSQLISTLHRDDPVEIEPVVSTDALSEATVGTRTSADQIGMMSDSAPRMRNVAVEQLTAPLNDQLHAPQVRMQELAVLTQEAPLTSLLTTTGAAVTENRGGTVGAIDRLTREIAASLKENRTQVMWLFDASLSLKNRRDAIADQFENVYKELGALKLGAEGALTTAVASYGERVQILTPEPLQEIERIRATVRAIPNDESGRENVFSAVQECVRRWGKYRVNPRRAAMLVIVTDEKGDDLEQLEAAIKLCRRQGIRCYVVGNAAIFARAKGYVRWTYADNTTEELPVDQGPETAALEGVQLGFWGTGNYDLERMSAAYGPYGLTRLCAETGGMFFIADESRVHRFDPDLMRNYLPDYRSLSAYEADLKKNRAKQGLVWASSRTAAEEIPLPRLVFRADNDARLKQQLLEAQKPAAELEHKLNLMFDALSAGEKDRERILEPRWQAGFDLAYGRVLAMRVRSHGYNAVLAEMKLNPRKFEDSENNHWILRASEEISSGQQTSKMAAKAKLLLEQVVREHSGTPWALMAKRELSQPFGWSWRETYFPVPENATASNRPANSPAEDRPTPPRPKPKL